jgi:dUTP pyrophosphatase
VKSPVPVEILRTPGNEDLPLPERFTHAAAGYDLPAALTEPLSLPAGGFARVPTGIRVALPEGYEGQVRPRSGLAARHGIGLLNAPGTIDADYRGEIHVILFNFGQDPFVIHRGDRIAQLVIGPVVHVEWKSVDSLRETSRGEGGFGHTGR